MTYTLVQRDGRDRYDVHVDDMLGEPGMGVGVSGRVPSAPLLSTPGPCISQPAPAAPPPYPAPTPSRGLFQFPIRTQWQFFVYINSPYS